MAQHGAACFTETANEHFGSVKIRIPVPVTDDYTQ